MTSDHEGFPLLLRTPAELDLKQLRHFQRLLIVKHIFHKVQPSGLPDAEYNDGLADLDHHLIQAPEVRGGGSTVLVETFGGKRLYYSYIVKTADIAEQEKLTTSLFPSERLEWETRDDPEWSFIKGYARTYGF